MLLVIVELSTLAARPDMPSKESIISTALFGDGAAAAVISAAPDAKGRAIEGSAEHLWPDSLDVMGWRIDPVGFGVILAPTVPTFVEKRLPEAAQGFFARMGLTGRRRVALTSATRAGPRWCPRSKRRWGWSSGR